MSFLDIIKKHIAGATLANKTDFDSLISLKNDVELSQEFIDKWIIPYYMEIGQQSNEAWVNNLVRLKPTINNEVIEKCLGDFNWRTRQTGAYFAAIRNSNEYVEAIGKHLLKSEVCYAGSIYCIVLAYFNTDQSITYLNTYLNYYLEKPDLWFDQRDAMQAIAYLDKINGTNYFEHHWNKWLKFIANKPYWEKEITTEHLEKQIEVIKLLQKIKR